MNTLETIEFNQKVDARVRAVVPLISRGSGFTDRKLTDTPIDKNQVVSRSYVTMNGTTGNRPTSSIVGQFYFDTTVNKPIWWNGTSFVDAQGSVV